MRVHTVPGEAMNRAALLRLAAAFTGGVAVVVVLAALVRMGAADGARTRALTVGAGWAVPIVAGATVGILSWLLLGGDYAPETTDSGLSTVDCPACGTELLREWRLCPYCGLKSDEAPCEEVASAPTA